MRKKYKCGWEETARAVAKWSKDEARPERRGRIRERAIQMRKKLKGQYNLSGRATDWECKTCDLVLGATGRAFRLHREKHEKKLPVKIFRTANGLYTPAELYFREREGRYCYRKGVKLDRVVMADGQRGLAPGDPRAVGKKVSEIWRKKGEK